MTINLFERAARAKLRFTTSKGLLTTEQLFDLPLTELNTVAKATNRLLISEGEDSFIETTTNREVTKLNLQLEIIKHVIEVKLSLTKAAETRAEKETMKRRLTDILANKQDEALASMSVKEIEKQLAAM